MPPPGHDHESDSDDEVLVKRIKKIKQATKSKPKQMQVRLKKYVKAQAEKERQIEITPIDVHLTLALPIGGRKVEEVYDKKPKDAKYNEVIVAWRKEWNLVTFLSAGASNLGDMSIIIVIGTSMRNGVKKAIQYVFTKIVLEGGNKVLIQVVWKEISVPW
ncbi:hypothetical protein Cgig2_002088 [Carnegiea gigantea]|uniref:Uncharacterized protein n=1 Tax=Carnegiea gigantea TaxID=171969 RepID=A0A9Q1GMZ9_9CARY|nr:hypothetical protein Cgig2_002088 [Carnegiea gigantea]